MLTDPKLRSQVDQLWDKLWTGGLTNPADAIEQLSYLIFLKRLDDEEDRRERQAQRRHRSFEPRVPAEMRWYPITTFLQSGFDMKNAMHVVPGQFERRGHDYRADTARFVLAAFRLHASDEQLARGEEALRRREKVEGEEPQALGELLQVKNDAL